jgi:ferric-dicitrate binding protein FerR (iron transport regulator)
MIDDELQDWVDKSLNETATEAEACALEDRLVGDAAARDYYLNAVNLHASLRRRFSAEEGLAVPSITPFPIATRRKLGFGLAIAAALALLALVIPHLTPSSPPTASITQVVGAYRGDGTVYVAGESVEPGSLTLARGLLRMDFSNGARVTVEGPAQFEVMNEMRVVLHRGVVTATIPESAVGFVVDTAAAHVVDLGTSFGVSVGENGQTDVCVFDGEVEVTNQTDTAPRLVQEGQAIRASQNSNTIDSVAYETARFENAWPVNSGVLQTTGSMRFVSPGPDFHPGNYEDNEHIVVFPERRGFASDQEIRVDLVDPGEFAKSQYHEKPILRSGQRLTSYLLQLDAYPEGKNPNRRRSVRGQITFAKPIVGVITSDRVLIESEEIFGLPDVSYGSARMIEPRPEGDLRPGFDSLVLAADRRTLFIELQENPGHLDQVRVLVEAK